MQCSPVPSHIKEATLQLAPALTPADMRHADEPSTIEPPPTDVMHQLPPTDAHHADEPQPSPDNVDQQCPSQRVQQLPPADNVFNVACPTDSAMVCPSVVATLPAARGRPLAPAPPQGIITPNAAVPPKRRRITPSVIKRDVRACINKLIKSVEKRHHQSIKRIRHHQQQQIKAQAIKQQRRQIMHE